MLVKEVSAKELLDFHVKNNRMVNLIRNSSQEAPSNNSPNTPLNNAEGKWPRLEVSSSPLVQILRNNHPSSLEGGDERMVNLIRNSSQEAPSNNSPNTPLNNAAGKRPRLGVSSSPPVQILRNNHPSSSEGGDERMVNLIRNSSQEAPSNNSPNTPLNNAEGKRPRLEVSNSPPVQILRNNHPSSSEGGGEMWTSFVTKINSSGDGDATSIWDDHFPLGELIDKHIIQEKFQEKVEELELERVLQTSLIDSVRSNFRLRVLAGKFRDMEKKNKTYVAEISELQKKLSENEKKYTGEVNELKKKLSEDEKKKAEMTSLKDELNKLKKSLEESSVEKSRLVGREKDLMEENSNIKTKLSIKEDAHKLIVDKVKAEIEELKGENKRQYKAGYDKAKSQVLSFTVGLKP